MTGKKARPEQATARSLKQNLTTEESSADFVQSLHTALSFLCWINADASVVDGFLRAFPEALLLEGTSSKSANCILEQRMRRCFCQTGFCNNNRQLLLGMLDRGFVYYQEQHMQDVMKRGPAKPLANFNSTRLFPQLMAAGRFLRQLSSEETAVRSQVLEINIAYSAAQRELEGAKASSRKTSISFFRALFSCGRKNTIDARLDKLKNELENVRVRLGFAEKEHRLLLQAIQQGTRNQHHLLKNAFQGCQRYSCGQEEQAYVSLP